MDMFKTMKYAYEEEVEVLEQVIEEEKEEIVGAKDLVVLNDDYNTFDHVINTLIKVCEHTPEQAEQCTMIIHYKGKCSVKKGTYEELKPQRDAICDAGIGAVIR
jgi:ATP-dependent Clp protease adaptor protein ClpS